MTAGAEVKDEVETRVEKGVGYLRLNRPAALNALSREMLEALSSTLAAWKHDPGISRVVMAGQGGKAFSAGADVRAAWEHARPGRYDAIRDYFAAEYAVDLELATYPKPVLAVVDGICFGAGMGLAVHSGHCIVTEKASLSMPETLIGFFPDAGATHFLSRLPGKLGLYLGMTGARLSGADAVLLDLAAHLVPQSRLDEAVAAFAASGPEAVLPLATRPDRLSLQPHLDEINEAFSGDSVEEIFAGLRALGTPFALDTLGLLQARSPSSLRWTLESQRQGRGMNLEQCLENELRFVEISTRHPDFVEGVRAALVDKDKRPRWQA